MEVPVDPYDFPPCMDHVALLQTIRGVIVKTDNGQLRIAIPADMTIDKAFEEIRKVQEGAARHYVDGGIFREPADYTEFAYNLHVFLHIHAEIGLISLAAAYAAHFGHPFPIYKFLPAGTDLCEGLSYFCVATVNTERGTETTVSPKLPYETTYRDIFALLDRNPPPVGRLAECEDEPDAKRRRIMADVDDDVLDSTIRAVYALLKDLAESVTRDEHVDQLDDVDVPIRDLETEFETRWKIKFDSEVFGVSSMLQFLKKFPKVFCVINNGIEMVVRPQPAPIFELPDEGGFGPTALLSVSPFTLGAATRLAGLCVNIVAENAAQNTELEERYVSYDQVQQLIDVFVDGKASNDVRAVDALQDVIRPDPDKIPAPPAKVN